MGNEEANEDDVADMFGNFEEDMDEDQSLHQAPEGQANTSDREAQRFLISQMDHHHKSTARLLTV